VVATGRGAGRGRAGMAARSDLRWRTVGAVRYFDAHGFRWRAGGSDPAAALPDAMSFAGFEFGRGVSRTDAATSTARVNPVSPAIRHLTSEAAAFEGSTMPGPPIAQVVQPNCR